MMGQNKRPTGLRIVVTLSAVLIGCSGIVFLAATYHWYYKVAPQVAALSDRMGWGLTFRWLLNFPSVVLLPVFGLVSLLCATGLVVFRNWARRLLYTALFVRDNFIEEKSKNE